MNPILYALSLMLKMLLLVSILGVFTLLRNREADKLWGLVLPTVLLLLLLYGRKLYQRAGNALKQVGSYTRGDGSTGQSADIWFQANDIYSIVTDPLPETPQVAVLPNAPGYRNVYDLHQAMLHDGSGHLQAHPVAYPVKKQATWLNI
ncbi:MAG: hypothetical protein PHR16_16630 [Methylovulum sp.]|nr:hypothetical protein [Methylovulum sp.]